MKDKYCLVHFDALGDVEAETKVCCDCWKVWKEQNPEAAKGVSWEIVDNIQQLLEKIPLADFIFFDYGGLSGAGHQSLGESFAREMEKVIEEHPSKEFILLCTMGKSWYEADYSCEHSNLHFEDRGWCSLFDKYLREI
jgi:hypothetical protein